MSLQALISLQCALAIVTFQSWALSNPDLRRREAPIRSSVQPSGEDATETSTPQHLPSPSSSTLQESGSVVPAGPPVLTIVAGALVFMAGLWAVASTIKGEMSKRVGSGPGSVPSFFIPVDSRCRWEWVAFAKRKLPRRYQM